MRSGVKSGILYHATFGANLRGIKEHGLGYNQKKNWDISEENVVYLTADKEVAFDFCECAEDVCDTIYNSGIVVFAVRIADLDLSKLKIDGNIHDEVIKSFVYKGIISADKLYVVTRNRVRGKLLEYKRVPRYES